MKNENQILDERLKEIEDTIPEKIDTSNFKPMSSKEIIDILGLTIKKDETNKLITFLCQLSAYTEDSQFNISFIAPSSTGKSYIPIEIAKLFPKEDVKEIGYCSPTAFFHETGTYIKEENKYITDLSQKILIFLDQPHTQLLERLRPILSHDKKEVENRITDKTQKFGMKTKKTLLIGYPSVIFCSAGLRTDEQESTRFLLLSPEISQEKIRESIREKIKKETDSSYYKNWVEENPERKSLKERILAIKQEKIKDIKIDCPEEIERIFFEKNKFLKSRHSRDIGRFISLIKSLALLNLWFREREEDSIKTNKDDIAEAFNIWEEISESQELNLSPYILSIYKETILPLYQGKNKEKEIGIIEEEGLSREEIIQKHYKVCRRFIPDWQLRQQIIPALENAGLIKQEVDPKDKRKFLIYINALST